MPDRRARRRPPPAHEDHRAAADTSRDANPDFGAFPDAGGPLFISETIGAEWLLHVAPSWDAAAERLRPYALETVLDVVGRVSALLLTAHGHQPETQRQICVGLFGNAQALWLQRRIESWLARRRREGPALPAAAQPVLFQPLALAAVVKIACSACERDRGPRPEGRGFDGIGDAILLANDLVEADGASPVPHDLDTLEGRLHWVQYAFIKGTSPGHDAATHALARAVDLFLSPHPEFAGDPDWVDLPRLFTGATGLDVPAYLRMLVAVLAPMLGITPDNAASRGPILPLERFRAAGFGDDVDRMIAFIGADAAAFRAGVRDRYPPPELRAYDVVVLEQAPVVRFGGTRLAGEAAGAQGGESLVCQSVGLLQERLTSGLYHTLLNAHAENDAAGRQRYQRFVGRVFEHYVGQVLGRMYGPSRTPAVRGTTRKRRAVGARPAYFNEATLRAALAETTRHVDHQSLCDGLVVWGDSAVLVESKAKFFALAARSGESPERFRARLEEIVVRGAGQLEHTARWLMSGAFAPLGVDPDRVAHILPLVVSLQELPINVLLRWWMDERLETAGVFASGAIGPARVYPVEVAHVSDLEWAEAAQARGLRLPDVLRRKHEDHWGQNHPLSTYAIVRGLAGAGWHDRNPYLERRYERLTAEAWTSLRSHLARTAPTAGK